MFLHSLSSFFACLLGRSQTSLEHWWSKIISVFRTAFLALRRAAGSLTFANSKYKLLSFLFALTPKAAAEKSTVDTIDISAFVDDKAKCNDGNSSAGAGAEQGSSDMVAEPNQAYSIDNAISSGDTEINKTDTESSDATFSTSTRYSTAAIDYNSSTTEGEDSIGQSILAKPASSPSIDNQSTFTEMRTSRHKTVYTINYEKLARKYGGVSMRIIQKARAEFFCWSDAVLQAHIRLVYAALPLWQQKKWTALMLAKLRFWHDTTFESAQSTSELLLAQHKIDGLTSPELRNILDTVHIF